MLIIDQKCVFIIQTASVTTALPQTNRSLKGQENRKEKNHILFLYLISFIFKFTVTEHE